jgi:hypothetical protein
MTSTTRTKEREQFLMDLLTTAVEGGIGYWARIYDRERTPELDWVKICLVDHSAALEDEELEIEPFQGYDRLDELVLACDERVQKYSFTVGIDDIELALLKIMADPAACKIHPNNVTQLMVAHMTDGEQGDFDADSGDWLVQIACFGEVIYG